MTICRAQGFDSLPQVGGVADVSDNGRDLVTARG